MDLNIFSLALTTDPTVVLAQQSGSVSWADKMLDSLSSSK